GADADADEAADVEPEVPADVPPDFAGLRCGDGILAPWEECDEGDANSFSGSCLPTCRTAACGDGFVRTGHEYCDDGNTVSGDACAADCLDGERIIETVAGGGVCDGLPARAASVTPAGLVVDTDRTVVVADGTHHRIRRVTADGRMTTVAGTGVRGWNGDGPTLTTRLNGPEDLALSPNGIVVADRGNRRVRVIERSGTIRTLVGNGGCWEPQSDNPELTPLGTGICDLTGIDARGNEIIVVDQSTYIVMHLGTDGLVRRIAGSGVYGFAGDDGPALAASFRTPRDVLWLSDGRVLVSDYVNGRVRAIGTDGILRSFATVFLPVRLAVSGSDVLVTHHTNIGVSRIRGGTVELVAGGGSSDADGVAATSARMGGAHGVAVESSGTVVVSDGNSRRVRRFTIGGVIDTIAGNGFANYCGDVGSAAGLGVAPPPGGWDYSATNAAIYTPRTIVVLADGTVVWIEEYNHLLRMMLPDGTIDTLAGNGTPGFADGTGRDARFHHPTGLAIDPDGNLVVVDHTNLRVRRVDVTTRAVTTIAGNGTVGDAAEGAVALASPLGRMTDAAVGADGTIYVTENVRRRVARIDPSGRIWTYAGRPGVTGDGGDGGRATSATFTTPYGLAIDSTGVLYVVDEGANRVRRIRPGSDPSAATIEAFAGSGVSTRYEGDGGPPAVAGLYGPSDAAVDPVTGAVFIVDRGHGVVRVVRDEGGATGLVIRTVAGDGSAGFYGDGGSALRAALDHPFGVAVDGRGGVYVTDWNNGRIRHAHF
ncbi:MAG: hypothetical protein QME96_14090, partial [Myxococcota bacterium]|nr:hypothetical protein [Myxococcota bacterium]